MCPPILSYIDPTVNTIFGVVMIFLSLATIIGNVVALTILRMSPDKSITNKILTSLAVSDLLAGIIVGPITVWQLIASTENCTLDLVRVYLSTILIGASVFTLGIIAYDRHVLLTKLNDYNLHMTKRKFVCLVSAAWVIPSLVPILRMTFVHAYLIIVCLIILSTFIILATSYYYITKAVTCKRKTLLEQKRTTLHIDAKGNSIEAEVTDDMLHLKLAHAVTLLISCYVVCFIPMVTWIVLDLINDFHPFMNITAHNLLYLFATLFLQVNSCLNPIIYILKNDKFMECLNVMICMKDVKEVASGDSHASLNKIQVIRV